MTTAERAPGPRAKAFLEAISDLGYGPDDARGRLLLTGVRVCDSADTGPETGQDQLTERILRFVTAHADEPITRIEETKCRSLAGEADRWLSPAAGDLEQPSVTITPPWYRGQYEKFFSAPPRQDRPMTPREVLQWIDDSYADDAKALLRKYGWREGWWKDRIEDEDGMQYD